MHSCSEEVWPEDRAVSDSESFEQPRKEVDSVK